MKRYLLSLFFLFLLVSNSHSQFFGTDNSTWNVGVSAGFAYYSGDNAIDVGTHYVHQIPRINISRYLLKGITLDAAVSFNAFDNEGQLKNTVSYTSYDGTVRYDFGTTYDNIVPYVLIGGSIISSARPTPTLNFGAGNTFWFSSKIGFNLQFMYKFSEDRFESQRSHIYFTAGLVYSFGQRTSQRRLWERR